MDGHLTGTNAAAVSGDSSVINIVVADQAGSGYAVVPMELPASEVAELRSDPNLDGRELDPAKLDGVIDGINPNQLYYSFDDASDYFMGQFNDALRELGQANAHIQAEITNDDAQALPAFDITQHDINSIRAVQIQAEELVGILQSEAVQNGIEGLEVVQSLPGILEDIGGAGLHAETIGEIDFGYNRPLPGNDYVDPDYDQFLPDTVDVSPEAEFEAAPNGLPSFTVPTPSD